jgi:short-subunit dehydrogenase
MLHGRTALSRRVEWAGVDFATLLAERGCHLILCARRGRLRTLAERARRKHGVRVR